MVCQQLDYNVRIINRALLIGTLIPLIFNITILTVGFRLFSQDELAEAARLGVPVFVLLKEHFNSNFFLHVGQCFSFFAIITSLIGVSMAMHGALHDLLNGQKISKLTEIFILIPLLIALIWPQLFFIVLGIVGGIFGNLMAGLLPVMPFLKPGFFRFRYLILWLVFLSIFILECANLYYS
jgi:tyrosine-specific transport protein